MFKSKIVLDSVSKHWYRLTTFEIEFPRIVLAEVVTHRTCYETSQGDVEYYFPERTATRDLSKNSASSRAIPIPKMLQKVIDDPYIPLRWSKAGKGMSASGWLEGEQAAEMTRLWLAGRDACVALVKQMHAGEVHKQDANRMLEPWGWTTQVITATNDGWSNFFHLRCDKNAHPAFRKIARMMYLDYKASQPQQLKDKQWHTPYVESIFWDSDDAVACANWYLAQFGKDPDDKQLQELLIKLSVARCAWVSYHPPGDGPTDLMANLNKAMGTYTTLAGNSIMPTGGGDGGKVVQSETFFDPVHASPMEHQGTPTLDGEMIRGPRTGNFTGFNQFRKMIPRERCDEYNPPASELNTWEEW